MVPDRRSNLVRRDLNNLIRDPQGRVSEAKTFSVLGKSALLYILLAYAQTIISNWEILVVIAGFLIAPDLIKKFLAMRAGVQSTPEKTDAK